MDSAPPPASKAGKAPQTPMAPQMRGMMRSAGMRKTNWRQRERKRESPDRPIPWKKLFVTMATPVKMTPA